MTKIYDEDGVEIFEVKKGYVASNDGSFLPGTYDEAVTALMASQVSQDGLNYVAGLAAKTGSNLTMDDVAYADNFDD